MYSVELFDWHDLLEIYKQDAQKYLDDYYSYETFKHLSGYTVRYCGNIIMCAGYYCCHFKRYSGWIVFSSDAGKHMHYLFKQIQRNLNSRFEFGTRIEATCDCNFKPAHRLLKMLGFVCEAECMANYDINGAAHSLYAKII